VGFICSPYISLAVFEGQDETVRRSHCVVLYIPLQILEVKVKRALDLSSYSLHLYTFFLVMDREGSCLSRLGVHFYYYPFFFSYYLFIFMYYFFDVLACTESLVPSLCLSCTALVRF